jgi:hypothetical protein
MGPPLLGFCLGAGALALLSTSAEGDEKEKMERRLESIVDDVDRGPDTLKVHRLTTPERLAFEKFCERRRAQTNKAEPEPVPVGSDPVEGFPVPVEDIRKALGEPTEADHLEGDMTEEEGFRAFVEDVMDDPYSEVMDKPPENP